MIVPSFASIEVLIRVDTLAQRYSCRPSALLNVTDPYLAYCVDEAAAMAGVHRELEQDAMRPAPPPPQHAMQTHYGGLLMGTFRKED